MDVNVLVFNRDYLFCSFCFGCKIEDKVMSVICSNGCEEKLVLHSYRKILKYRAHLRDRNLDGRVVMKLLTVNSLLDCEIARRRGLWPDF